MYVGLVRMNMPHQLINGSMDAGGYRGIWLVQRYPGKVQKFTMVRLQVYCPLMSSPVTIYTNDDWGLRRRSRDGFDIGTQNYESRSPVICGCPVCMERSRHDSVHPKVIVINM